MGSGCVRSTDCYATWGKFSLALTCGERATTVRPQLYLRDADDALKGFLFRINSGEVLTALPLEVLSSRPEKTNAEKLNFLLIMDVLGFSCFRDSLWFLNSRIAKNSCEVN